MDEATTFVNEHVDKYIHNVVVRSVEKVVGDVVTRAFGLLVPHLVEELERRQKLIMVNLGDVPVAWRYLDRTYRNLVVDLFRSALRNKFKQASEDDLLYKCISLDVVRAVEGYHDRPEMAPHRVILGRRRWCVTLRDLMI